MKKFLTLAMTLIMAVGTSFAQEKKEAKSMDDIQKERQEIRKMSKKVLYERADKSTRKEAKRLEKEGWKVHPGQLPLEKQLEDTYLKQCEYDEDLFPKYVMGQASSVGEHYDAARTAAFALAITDLASHIQTEVTALVENTVANKQLSAEEAASISETVMTSKNLISQSIGRTITVLECYRINDKKNTEVLMRIAYDSESARKSAKKALRAALEEKGDALQKQLDLILGF